MELWSRCARWLGAELYYLYDVEMKQPIQPSKEDCCNSGCNPCVFDVYDKQVKLYEEYLKNGKVSDSILENAISQLEYSPFKVVVNDELCPSHRILGFKIPVKFLGKKVHWKPGDHFLVRYKSMGISCSRAYTPVKYKINENGSDFEIILKQYDKGIVSNYLSSLSIGQETLWRGPYGSFELVTNKFNRVIMIAQGTGIAPFYSILQSILNNEDDFTKLVLYFCCKSQDTILFRDELYSFKSYWNFSYQIFSSCDSKCNAKYQEPVKCRKLELADIKVLKPFTIKDQFLLCGSSPFMNVFKALLSEENISIDNIVLF